MKALILALAIFATHAHAADLADVQAIDAQIAALKAHRAAVTKALGPVERAQLRVLKAHEALAKAQERAGKPTKAPQQGQRRGVML